MEGSVAPRDAGEPRAKAGSSSQGDGGAEDSNSKKKPNPTGTNRKRTKTGCLTCRKRRIKCDEGRPTCNNCIKSKRSCEGYNQRVVFKQNIGADPYSGSFAPFGYIHGAPHPLSQIASQQARSSGRGPLPTIAPRPPAFDYHHPPHGFQYEVPYPATVQGATHSAPPGFDFGPGSFPAPSSDAFAHPPPPPQPNPLISANLPGSYGQHAPQFHSHDLPFVGQPEYYTLEQTPPSTQYSSNLDFPPPDPIPETNLPILPAVQIQHEAYESSDENASMADSDDGEQTSKSLMAPVVLGMQGHDARDVSLRSFSAFARNDALGEYMSSPHASELKDHAKRKLFEHFLRVTGPTMSLYERHPFDPAEREMANHISEGRSNIWSYTFPVISFHHPALLHAILAMSSLQVSKLQQNPATAAIKHYHIALRRVAKNVQAPLKRLQPATLAATLLLAYFEVWNSEHNKWCSHLYGARTLFAEIPLRQKARSCLPAKSLRDRQRVMRRMGLAGIGAPLPGDPNALDFDLLTTITGYHVTAADYGLREDQIFQNANSTTTEKEIETFENLRDLFWWYCKMDIYQSMLGGTKLFMEYEHWTQCPPRAPAAKLDGIFGTYDHLMLLLGRLASFASNDMARKRKSSRSKGSAPGGNSPPFAGMFPAETTVRPPMGFSPPKTTESHDDGEDIDPQESYKAALHEWSGIQHAFEVFEGYLGSEFRHLSPEYSDRRDEPFGPALQYRTYSVAGIWMNYYMGLIHLHRSHPDMPPTAMQSVGLSARKTAVFANQIGRIAVGLSDDTSRMTEVSTVLAAALVESAFCLFVAAVQFQDGTQRDWVVRRMHDITRLTAWQSARQIANGCESYWTKAAQFGRGPPYVRPADLDDRDSSIWNSPRRIDRRIQEVDQTAGPERRVVLARADRAHYALGLLGVEDDLEYLELKDDTFNREGEDEDEGGDA